MSQARAPATTLAFLFSDIEGSTRRWEHQRAVGRHPLLFWLGGILSVRLGRYEEALRRFCLP